MRVSRLGTVFYNCRFKYWVVYSDRNEDCKKKKKESFFSSSDFSIFFFFLL